MSKSETARRDGATPWYRRARRWGQTNLTEIDPPLYDRAFWRAYWRRTRIEGVIVNAGGIVAYYPSRFELHYRAEHLGGRDLLGEIVADARAEGLAVVARMDSNRAAEPFYRAHPEWFAVNAAGEPCRTQGRYQACVNGPCYREYLPEILREIIAHCRPDGFADNSWTGLHRSFVCHCRHCREKFGRDHGRELPRAADWDDETYRLWLRWSYACRLENWDLNNRVTRETGGPDCLWLGMVNGNPVSTHLSCCDLRAAAARSPIVLCDHQSRDAVGGFEQNGLNGKLLHELAGWDTLVPESMALYVRGAQAFRRASNPPEETRAWIRSGFAGGISPWWHHVGAAQEDRRAFETVEPLMRWHEEHEDLLHDREPVADVGLVWSHENTDFHGRDDAKNVVLLPWRGFTRALTRARIPYLPVHADDVARAVGRLRVLALPDVAAMSDAQCEAIRAFVAAGGGLVATGRSSRLDEWGRPRSDFGLADVFGARATGRAHGASGAPASDWEIQHGHTYIRLPAEPAPRHEILAPFGGTDLLPFGGVLQDVQPETGAEVAATYVPAFPIYPPEFSWMRQPATDVPALIAREAVGGGRVVYLPGDVDRCAGRQALPDHLDLLAYCLRWAARGPWSLTLEGVGWIDAHLYRQGARRIVHLVNLTAANEWPGYVEDTIPVGPLRVTVRTAGAAPRSARLAVAGATMPVEAAEGGWTFAIPQLREHELAVIE